MPNTQKIEKTCLQCGKTLYDPGPNEKWCPTKCYREWFLARNPGWELTKPVKYGRDYPKDV